jgi:hypothetical protein
MAFFERLSGLCPRFMLNVYGGVQREVRNIHYFVTGERHLTVRNCALTFLFLDVGKGGWKEYAEMVADGAWHVVAVPLLKVRGVLLRCALTPPPRPPPKVILISIIFGFVVLSSTAVYMAFYQFYVPALGAFYDLHFDFT